MSTRLFTPSWLQDNPQALNLLPRPFADRTQRAAAVRLASQRQIDSGLLATIETHSAAQEECLSALAKPGTVCVVTGQQAGLFGGPLYTIYKAAAAIANARQLTAETGVPCVPVFWLQNEDHDFAEIAQCTVLNAAGKRCHMELADPSPEPRSIAFRALSPDLDRALDTLGSAIGELRYGSAVMTFIREHYHVGKTADACFKTLIQALLGRHGLLVVDPSHPDLATAARAVHQRAIEEALPIAALLGEQSKAMATAGFKVPVHIRPNAPLSFLHPDGKAGPRYRIEPIAEGYRLCGTQRAISANALQQALDTGALSTSALLRPIMQDTWLPTAAYVGGPGEIDYFAQLPPLYAHFGLPMPLIVPRARFSVGDGNTQRLLRALGISADMLARPWPTLLETISVKPSVGPTPEGLQADLLDPFNRTMATALPSFATLDPSLVKAAQKTETAVATAVARLMDRYRRAETLNDSVAIDRLERLRLRLYPDGTPQERIYGWPHCAARYGIDEFTDAVLNAVVPFAGDLKELQF